MEQPIQLTPKECPAILEMLDVPKLPNGLVQRQTPIDEIPDHMLSDSRRKSGMKRDKKSRVAKERFAALLHRLDAWSSFLHLSASSGRLFRSGTESPLHQRAVFGQVNSVSNVVVTAARLTISMSREVPFRRSFVVAAETPGLTRSRFLPPFQPGKAGGAFLAVPGSVSGEEAC